MPQAPSRRRSRSRSPKPSPPHRRDYVAASHSPGPGASPASSRSPSRRANAAANTARVSAFAHLPAHFLGPQNSTGHLFVDGAPDDFGGQPFLGLPPFTWPYVGGSNLAQMTTAPRSVAQHYDYPPYLPHPPDSSQSQQSLYKNTGIFNQAHDFMVTGTFVDSSVTYNNTSSNQFMKELLEKTIPGAEFDSSDRDPPPRCHPGTRLAILERCLCFISHCDGVKKMRWVVGAAGVGKFAIMQSVAEAPELPVAPPASVFFSINGRNDGNKAVITLSYQFAAKSALYRQVIEQEIARDPSVLRSSMAKQFDKLIVEPFIHKLKSVGRVLVIIDGLDECNNHRTQQELLRLISDLCLMYPSSPLVWLIASRPEPQITSFFSRPNVIPAYEKEEIPIDSAEAFADVERFLRGKLTEIKEESDSLDPQWPEERDIWKLASAAGGLFAYAQTVTRYIGDSRIGSPVSQFSDVLHVIDNHPMADLSREEHPMALLDALYDRILSNVPDKIMINTRKLLVALASGWGSVHWHGGVNFIVLCNWLGMTPDEAYAAVNHLRSILHVPHRNSALTDHFMAFHKSFIDYISDFSRSKFSPDICDEARRLAAQCTTRIAKEVSNDVSLGKSETGFYRANLTYGPLIRDKILLTWSVVQANGWTDGEMRLRLYKQAVEQILNGMKRGHQFFQSESHIRFLTTAFDIYNSDSLHDELLNVVFDESRRLEFIAHGTLKQMPLEAVSGILYDFEVKLQFRRPATTVTNLSDPWNSSCRHERKGEWGVEKDHGWVTAFRGGVSGWTSPCTFCFERLKYQLKNWKARSPDNTAIVLFTSAAHCCVEVRFVDPEHGMSEWTYSFWCIIPWEERKKYGGLYDV